MLLQSQHHLEVRVRYLEVERNNLKQLVRAAVTRAAGHILYPTIKGSHYYNLYDIVDS